MLGLFNTCLENTTLIRSTLPPGSYKTSFDTSPSPKLLSLQCKQIKKVKNELDRQPLSLLGSMHISIYKANFALIFLAFLKLETHRPHPDFETLDGKNNEVIPRTFYLQRLNKNGYIGQWNKNLSRFKLYGTTARTTNISIEQIVRKWDIFPWWHWGSQTAG